MAFDLKFLQPVGGNARGGAGASTSDPGKNAGASWNYAHPTDSLATIVAAGYFNEVRDLVSKWDAIKLFDSTEILRQAWFDSSFKSPSTANVTISTLDLDATS